MNIRQTFSSIFVLTVMALFLSGCMPLRPETDPQMDKKAFSLSNEVRSFNRHITASRGKGWAKLETPGKTDRYRIAWAAVYPDKIRITFLLSGNPVETVISTGEKISFISHTGKHDLYTTESIDPDMKDYLEVPVKMSELISILVGHIPLKDFDDAYFSPSDPSLATIVTMQKETGGLQHLKFNSEGKLNRIESLDNFGKILYEIQILDYKIHESFVIPVKLQIKDSENGRLTLDMTDFEPNPSIKASVFELTE
jgi:outer membrane lipoprotein-sorting protein